MRREDYGSSERRLSPTELAALNSEYDILIPTCIFRNRNLSVLEALVVFLRKNHGLQFSDIARRMNRDARNIWAAYQQGVSKDPEAEVPSAPSVFFSLAVTQDRSLSIFEIIIEYLRDTEGLSNAGIARLLERDPRTVSTVYRRAVAKREQEFNSLRGGVQ